MFRVYSVEKSMTGRAVVQAEHISYLLAAYPVQSVQLLALIVHCSLIEGSA